ncbi:WXG100 family type VII secretion target [Nocardia miyunensis]|uniref:WXG100 family type VII secretion target n=1 Tax=Nocardia miyunensis TaxID=282684 RepID=UPI0008356516|nr:WXG100 family type VII secretion target [Nocardia miyunensis]
MTTQYLDFDTFQKYANAYASVIEPINKTIDQLRDSVESAKSGWEGDAYTAFNNFATQLEDKISQVNKDLNQVSEALNTGEKTISSSDNETSSGFTSLSSNYS